MPRTRPFALPFHIVFTGLALACGGGDDGGGGLQEPPVVTSVTITAPALTLQVGQTLQLAATALDQNGNPVEGRTFEWTTETPLVATVSADGVVTAVSPGPALIRAGTDGVTGALGLTITEAPPEPPPGGPVVLGLEPVVSGLKFLTTITSAPGDPRLFVLEKAGVIRVIQDGALLPAPFLDLTAKVSSTAGEQGLLGLAFFPDYATSGRFIVHYNDKSNTNRVSLFQVSADPNRGDPASEAEVLAVQQPGVAHNGGQVVFGPDGKLYIGLGDGDDSDNGRAQSLADLLGNILRIDVSAGAPYTVPADNPFVATPNARPEVWSYGLRNPWRFQFDRATGDLYIGDVGESTWEEVDYSSAAVGAGRGVNFGWSVMEGLHCAHRDCNQTGLTLPVTEYNHSDGCAVVSGGVYRGAAIPQLQGTYFYADYCDAWVRSFRIAGGAPTEPTEWPDLAVTGQITSFGEDSAGELYLATQQGAVYKIVAR